MSENEHKTFTFINNEILCGIIKSATKHVIYAAPSVSESVAKSLCEFNENNKDAALRVIIDADPEAFRLGFGEQAGLKLLAEKQIDIRRASGLRIAVIAADDNAWVYSPTPEIIFEQPTDAINNAIQVSIEFAKQILFSIAPDISVVAEDNILDESFIADNSTPEIGAKNLTEQDLETIEVELKENPPQKFDSARQVRVYQGHLQFVEMSLSGCRLTGHTIVIPKELVDIDDSDLRYRVKTTCSMMAGKGGFSVKVKVVEDKVRKLRKDYIKSLGVRYGSVILRKKRKEFDKELGEITEELKMLGDTLKDDLQNELAESRQKLIALLLPGVMKNMPPQVMGYVVPFVSEKEARRFIADELEKQMPDVNDFIGKMELSCDFKDVTFEMLNDKEFFDLIEEKYPDEEFAKLYSEKQTIAQREKNFK